MVDRQKDFNLELKKFDNSGKYSIVTGAAGLLGKMHVEALLETNSNIIALDKNVKGLKKLKENFENKFKDKKILVFNLDITNEKEIIKISKILIKKKIFPEILINNAGNNPKVKKSLNDQGFHRLESFEKKIWDQNLEINLTSYFLMIKIFGSLMAKKNKGIIINIASDLGLIAPNQNLYKLKNRSYFNQPVKPITYSISKHAITGLTKYVSTYWSDRNVRCNTISPGGVLNNQSKSFLSKVSKQIPLGRLALVDEYKSTIQFMCSDASSYMNGQNMVVDGGRSIW